MSHRSIIIYCGLLLSLSAFSIDIILPAFSVMKNDMGSTDATMQLMITLYLMAFGVGQIVFGVLSDRFGRRKIIFIGLIIYLFGSIVAIFAPSVETLLAARILQGLGGASGPVVGRAVIRDIYTGKALARAMATAMAIFSFGPIVAPFIGVGLTELGGWRFVFVGTGIFGMLLALFLIKLPETNNNIDINALRFQKIKKSIQTIYMHEQSRFFILTSSITMIMMLSFISNAPILFESVFHIVKTQFALFFAIIGIGIIFGQMLNHRFIVLLNVSKTIHLTAIFMFFTISLMLILAIMDWLTLLIFISLMFLFVAGFVVLMSNFSSLCLDPHPQYAGMASALIGFVPQIFAGIIVSTLNFFLSGQFIPWILTELFVLITILILLFYRYKKTQNMFPN